MSSLSPLDYSVFDGPDHTSLRRRDGHRRGLALVAISREAARAGDDDRLLHAHSIFWEAREIYRTLLELGFDVDVVDLGAPAPRGTGTYQVAVTLHSQLLMLGPVLAPNAVRIVWLTGSHPQVQNDRELERVRALEKRRSCHYEPKRLNANVEAQLAAVELADHCVLIGNDTTLSTYPERLRVKIQPFDVSAANVTYVKSTDALVPDPREFVWFSASGAVLKGLDLLLDLFGSRDFPTLHVVGAIQSEADFMNIYHAELEGHPRIKVHGFLHGNDPALAGVFSRCVAVIHPSASEGMAGSVAHCLLTGLYPIVSRVSGIDLPHGCGHYLELCTIDEIAAAVTDVMTMPEPDLQSRIATLQEMAHERFSRESFARRLRDVFGCWLA